MHVISTFDSPEFLAKIIKSGKFDCNEKTDSGYDFEINGTPLIIALKNKRFDNFDLILNHYKDKLDLKLADSEGKSVVDYCKEFQYNKKVCCKNCMKLMKVLIFLKFLNKYLFFIIINNNDCPIFIIIIMFSKYFYKTM